MTPAELPPSEDGGHKPARQVFGSARDWSVIQLGAQHLMGQPEGAHGPIGSPPVTSEEILPVEACWQGFQRRANVTKP